MGIFKVGMQVRVITQHETEHFGEVGRIRNVYNTDPHRPYEVDFGDELEEFDADEIEPVILVQLAPADADAPAAGRAGAGESHDIESSLDSFDYATAMIGSEFIRAGNYEKVKHHFKDLDEWKRDTEAELAALRQQLADAKDQIIVHQGTLGIILPWLLKANGYTVEDGFTDDAIIAMVRNDLEAANALNPMYAVQQGGE